MSHEAGKIFSLHSSRSDCSFSLRKIALDNPSDFQSIWLGINVHPVFLVVAERKVNKVRVSLRRSAVNDYFTKDYGTADIFFATDNGQLTTDPDKKSNHIIHPVLCLHSIAPDRQTPVTTIRRSRPDRLCRTD